MTMTAPRELASCTTLRLGGPARHMLVAADQEQLVRSVAEADAAGEPLLLVAGGSNLVVSDEGFDGTVVRVATRGIEQHDGEAGSRLVAAAGESWDELVARACERGLRGIECLSGIPGSVGATPIQNVGAYGASISDVLVAVRVYDRRERAIVELDAAACEFGYRSSIFKHDDRFVVLDVTLELERAGTSAPIRYAELARTLGVEVGDRAPLAAVRSRVLDLRRSKGMVVDPADPDSVSAGSFFTNPVLDLEAFERLTQRAEQRLGDTAAAPPAWPDGDAAVKTSAAWLIEHAGFSRGHGDGRVGLSSKHTLALVNRGGATTSELLAFARTIRDGVEDAFGVRLYPEPTLVGVTL